VKTVDALYAAGAASVYACASHAVLSGPAIDRIANSRLEQLVVTNTIPLREAAQKLTVASAEGGQKLPKIKVLSIAGLLGAAIESIHMETSVSTLFS
jgi:ribose-phosphate pyrophosphokinase